MTANLVTIHKTYFLAVFFYAVLPVRFLGRF